MIHLMHPSKQAERSTQNEDCPLKILQIETSFNRAGWCGRGEKHPSDWGALMILNQKHYHLPRWHLFSDDVCGTIIPPLSICHSHKITAISKWQWSNPFQMDKIKSHTIFFCFTQIYVTVGKRILPFNADPPAFFQQGCSSFGCWLDFEMGALHLKGGGK